MRSWVHAALLGVVAGLGMACWRAGPPVPPTCAAIPEAATEPKYTFPVPPGPSRVGTVIMNMIDPSRPEEGTADPFDTREVVVQLFYPTDADGPAAGVMTAGEAALAVEGHWHSLHRDVAAHAISSAPMSTTRSAYPVIVYSHGLGDTRQDNRSHLEALASQGFVVAAISHSYYDCGSTLTSGRVATCEGYSRTTRDQRNQTWSQDIHFVLGNLGELSDDAACGIDASRLDLQAVGMFGWSTGGAAALRACNEEPRCRGAATLDALFGPLAVSRSKPVMFIGGMRSFWSQANWELVAERTSADAYSVWLDGVDHFAFSSLILAGLTTGALDPCDGSASPDFNCGPLEGAVAQRDYSAYVEAFFRQTLRGERPALLEGPNGVVAGSPEVVFERTSPGMTPPAPIAFGVATNPFNRAFPDNVAVQSTAGTVSPPSPYGRWMVTGLPSDSTATVRLSTEGYWPTQVTLTTGRRNFEASVPMLPTGDALSRVLGSTGISPVEGLGHVAVVVSQFQNDSFGGVVLEGSSGQLSYMGPDGVANKSLRSTATVRDVSWTLFSNVDPGTFSLKFSHPSAHCTASRSPSPSAGVVEVEVAADTFSFIQIVCEP